MHGLNARHILQTSRSFPSLQIELFIPVRAKRSHTSGSQQKPYDEFQQSIHTLKVSADAEFLVPVVPEHLILFDELF